LEVFDANGIRHFSTTQQLQPKGNKIVIDWDGRANNGGLLLPGKYYYKVIVLQNGISEQMLNGLLKF
jgi:flagellar hook assembly protein FlgD